MDSRKVNFRSENDIKQSNGRIAFFTCEENGASNKKPRIMFFDV